MSKRSIPLSMRPAGFKGRLFGFFMEWINTPNYRLALELLEPKPGQALLEIGFGTGKLLEMLARHCEPLSIAGIDPTPTMIETAQRRLIPKREHQQLDLRCGVAEALPWGEAAFDAIYALNCFQFWENPQQAASEIKRVLRPGGQIVIIFRDHRKHAPDWLPNPISRKHDEIDGAMELFKAAGFAEVKLVPNPKSIQAIVATS